MSVSLGACLHKNPNIYVSWVRVLNPTLQNSCFKVALEREVKDHLLTALLGNYSYLYAFQR